MAWYGMALHGTIRYDRVFFCVGAACTCSFAYACVDVCVHESVYLYIQVCVYVNATLCHAICGLCA